jgi:hypothetical protein
MSELAPTATVPLARHGTDLCAPGGIQLNSDPVSTSTINGSSLPIAS